MATASDSGLRTEPDVSPTSECSSPAVRADLRLSSASLEARTQRIGTELFARIGRGPMPWQRAWWDDRFMAWTLGDPRVRVQLFRFIDTLPALKRPEAIRRHLEEYLTEAGDA